MNTQNKSPLRPNHAQLCPCRLVCPLTAYNVHSSSVCLTPRGYNPQVTQCPTPRRYTTKSGPYIQAYACRIGKLKVEAEASTDSRPLPGFTPRAGPGLALFGKSNTDPPVRPNMRINFQFDQAAFDIKCVWVSAEDCGIVSRMNGRLFLVQLESHQPEGRQHSSQVALSNAFDNS